MTRRCIFLRRFGDTIAGLRFDECAVLILAASQDQQLEWRTLVFYVVLALIHGVLFYRPNRLCRPLAIFQFSQRIFPFAKSFLFSFPPIISCCFHNPNYVEFHTGTLPQFSFFL